MPDPSATAAGYPLLGALRDPALAVRLDEAALDRLLQQARQHDLLARLEADLAAGGLLELLPEAARRQLANARIEAAANATMLRFETDRVHRALAGLGTRIVLLKGAAYLSAGLPPARGRLAVDLDILVPRAAIGAVERALTERGWRPELTDAYDQHYYRDWMHEIPPLVHAERGTELDVHHTLFPPVSGISIDAEALFADATSLADGLAILSPCDMVLHSATHVFQENPAGRVRDLLDIHDLLAHFAGRPRFWDELPARARRHGLCRPLYYALRYSAALLGTDVPPAVLAGGAAGLTAAAWRRRAMDWLMRAAIVGGLPGQGSRAELLARQVLALRGHWMKMPPGILLRHSLVKTRVRMGLRLREWTDALRGGGSRARFDAGDL